MSIRVLLADDQALARTGFQLILEPDPTSRSLHRP
jgi:DNA-binding NarL/FixJ family response regulator